MTEEKYDNILNNYYGYNSLKKEQYEIIYQLVNKGKDVMAILSTGYGKSICFQLPHLITGKCVIVLSPLLSLMKDQETILTELGIPVLCLNSQCKDKKKAKREVIDGENKIIYITPEYFVECENFIRELESQERLCLFAIDECHVLSSWSHEFRPTYKELNKIREWTSSIPILAVTATASEPVRNDVCKILKLNNPHMIIGELDRKNLYLEVRKSTRKNIKNDLSKILSKFKNEHMIIYCVKRDDTHKIADEVNKLGIKAEAYHAGIDADLREKIQDDFKNGVIKCIIATIAFGMGIDVRSIRLVIHYGLSRKIESYYQEIGRNARDGKEGECYLIYSTKDLINNEYFISQEKNDKYRTHLYNQNKFLKQYVTTDKCRRIPLLKVFGEFNLPENCGNCDNCKISQASNMIDYSKEIYKILFIIDELENKKGKTIIIDILRGSNNKKITETMKNIKFYNTGKDHSIEWWKTLIGILISDEYLLETSVDGGFGSTISLTKKSINYLKNNIEELEPLLFNEIIVDGDAPSDNANKKWSNEEEKQLIDVIKDLTIEEIAINMKRTSGSIKSRINLLIIKLSKDKKLSELKEIFGYSEEKLSTIINNHEKIKKKDNDSDDDDPDDKQKKEDVKYYLDNDNKQKKEKRNIKIIKYESKTDHVGKLKKNSIDSSKNDTIDESDDDIKQKDPDEDSIKSNARKRWSEEEEEELLSSIKKLSIDKIAENLKRSKGSITSRLDLLVTKLAKEKNIDELKEIFGFPENKIKNIIYNDEQKKKSKNEEKDKNNKNDKDNKEKKNSKKK
jgi:RecQ family ATP-dependent DNA helicase